MRFSPFACLVGFAGLLLAGAPLHAQNLYVTENRTIAGGDPINGSYGLVIVGADSNLAPFPGVRADVTGGTTTGALQARNGSQVNVLGGTVQRITGYNDSVINLRGGVINGPADFSGYPVNSFGVSVINYYGGVVASGRLAVSETGSINIYGTNLSSTFLNNGQLGNYSGSFYSLSGMLRDGTSLEGFRLFDGGASSSPPGQNFRLINASAAPEPGVLPLIALGLLCSGALPCRRREMP